MNNWQGGSKGRGAQELFQLGSLGDRLDSERSGFNAT